MTLRFAVLRAAALEASLDDLAALRIAVFRDWPYLYDGDPEYERRYLADYRDNPGAVLVGAYAGDRLVGAATGAPMEDHAGEFGAAFAGTDHAVTKLFYCAESVLLPGYRGQGAGHAFFDHREGHARALGRSHVCFCAVERPLDHPLRPPHYRPLDGFWHKRGYVKLPGVTARFGWKDIDQPAESDKTLQFWIRKL